MYQPVGLRPAVPVLGSALKTTTRTKHPRLGQTSDAQQRCRFVTTFATAPLVPDAPIPPPPMQVSTESNDVRHPPAPYKPATLRKTQLHRQYTSLIRSTPLMLLFQHNNLKATEWAAIRRELAAALRRTSKSSVLPGMRDPADSIRITAIQSGIFAAALRVVEFYRPTAEPGLSAEELAVSSLSRDAYAATLHHSNTKVTHPQKKWRFDTRPGMHRKKNTPLHKLLHGPIAVLSFADVTPEHLAAALTILAPTPGATSAFPAPRRKNNPTYYEDAVQTGLQKLVLLGARAEGRTMDGEGVRWIGGLAKSGGLEGLRAQLVHLLQSVGGGVTNVLESASKSLWITMQGRRLQLEEEGKPAEEKERPREPSAPSS